MMAETFLGYNGICREYCNHLSEKLSQPPIAPGNVLVFTVFQQCKSGSCFSDAFNTTLLYINLVSWLSKSLFRPVFFYGHQKQTKITYFSINH